MDLNFIDRVYIASRLKNMYNSKRKHIRNGELVIDREVKDIIINSVDDFGIAQLTTVYYGDSTTENIEDVSSLLKEMKARA